MFVTFPQYPEHSVYVSYYNGVDSAVLTEVKTQLRAANPDYDYCFLGTQHLISLNQLYQSLHRSIQTDTNGTSRAKTLNAEIIFNLSPVNNIMDAFKRFGVDETRDDVIVIKVLRTSELQETESSLASKIQHLLKVESPQPLTNELLYTLVNIPKFKKLYKLNDATVKDDQDELSNLAIGACILRGC